MNHESAEERAEEKETRRILRQVQDHFISVHLNLGAKQESVGMVEVFYHLTNPLAALNYVTPRRNTAWVSGKMIEPGLDALRQRNRIPRVQFMEGLFPPLFAKTLRGLNLEVERETPMMVYKIDGINHEHVPPAPKQAATPDGITLYKVQDQRGAEAWWYVWRNAYYDVLTLGVEPLFVGRDMASNRLGQQIDYIAYRYGFPVGVARVSVQGESANILALALLKEVRTPEMVRLLQVAAMQGALESGAKLLFAPGETDADRKLCRDLGFVDFGSVVCYAPTEAHEDDYDDRPLEQPVLSF
jgi:hypothetical protein